MSLTTLSFFLLVTCHNILNGLIRLSIDYQYRNIVTRGMANNRTEELNERFKQTKGMKLYYPNREIYGMTNQSCRLVNGRRVVATFGSRHGFLAKTRKICEAETKLGEFDACLAMNEQFLDDKFKSINSKILKAKRGGGYWLWKPYSILRTLLEINDGDFLLYHDADHKLVSDFEEMICLQAEMKQNIVTLYLGAPESQSTKTDAFLLMNADNEKIRHSIHVQATYLFMTRSSDSLRFIGEWLTYSQDSRIITDQPSRFGKEWDIFQENRHDQSTLSLSSKRWNLTLWSIHITAASSDKASANLFNPYTYDMIPVEKRPTKVLWAPMN